MPDQLLSLPHRLRTACLTAVAAACVSAACQSSSSTPAAPAVNVTADTFAVVDNREITRADVDRAYQRAHDPAQTPSEEEVLTAKLGLLNELIGQEILLGRAKSLNLEVGQTELDTAYNDARKNINEEDFNKELAQRGLNAADMRENMRRDLLTKKVIAQEIGGRVNVTEQEINDFFNANRAQFNIPEESYHLAQIVITPVRDQQISNASGDDATTPQAANAKVQMLLDRLKAGASFAELANGFSEDPESAPRGGDLGLVPVSRLRQAPPPLRDAVLNKAPGSVNIASVGGAHTLVLVVAHEQAGQRDLSTPAVRERITTGLRGRREQLLTSAYLSALRNDAKIVNYFAKRLLETNPAAPALAPAAPAK